MMARFSQIREKYKKFFYKIDDQPAKGTIVTYFPSYEGMVYLYYDGVYESFKLKPGDTMTIIKVKKDSPCYTVYVKETKYPLSPAELLPEYLMDEKDKNEIIRLYNKKFKIG